MRAATRSEKVPATRRILDATRALISRGGAAQVSIGQVAEVARVSKALVHYHFRDKESLLRALVEDVGFAVIARARAFTSDSGTANVLDSYWDWLSKELDDGDLSILLALAEYDSVRVRDASKRIAEQRNDAASEQVQHIFTRLSLSPRVPAPVIARTVMAFVDGLAVHARNGDGRDPRPAFDVLWLALLTLAE
jgi:AcrR family transcriptional regulator